MSKSVADVAPVSSEQNITVNPNFILECKWLYVQEEMKHFHLPTLLA
jgi:hypothetical protein